LCIKSSKKDQEFPSAFWSFQNLSGQREKDEIVMVYFQEQDSIKSNYWLFAKTFNEQLITIHYNNNKRFTILVSDNNKQWRINTPAMAGLCRACIISSLIICAALIKYNSCLDLQLKFDIQDVLDNNVDCVQQYVVDKNQEAFDELLALCIKKIDKKHAKQKVKIILTQLLNC